MRYLFEEYSLDMDRRELRRGTTAVAIEPQVFDLLVHLIRYRDRVVSKDDLVASVWHGIDPEVTITKLCEYYPFRREAERQRLIAGMRKGGVPER